MALADIFDAIVIINVSRRRDRRAETRRMLRRVGWDPDGRKVAWFPAIDTRSAAGFSNPAVRGCFLSHVAVLNMARNAGHERILVLEDDCEFTSDFLDRQAEVAGGLESVPWGIAYLGHAETISGPPRLVGWNPGAGIGLTHCYAVAGEVISRLPRYLEAITMRAPGSPEGGPMDVDGAIGWFRRENPDVATAVVAPSLAYQRSSRSDLSPSWFDRLPVSSSVAAYVRVMQRAFSNL